MFRKMTHSFALSLCLAANIPNLNACTRDEIYNDAPWGGCTCDWLEACGGAAIGAGVAAAVIYALETKKVPQDLIPGDKIEAGYLACMAVGMEHCSNWDWPESGDKKRKCGLKMCDKKALDARRLYLAHDKSFWDSIMNLSTTEAKELKKTETKNIPKIEQKK